MNKVILSSFIGAACASIASADLVVGYSVAGQPGNQASNTASVADVNITASTLVRGAGLTATTAGSSMNSNAFTSGSTLNQLNNDYYAFGFNVNAGLIAIDVTSIVIGLQRSNTGPSMAALYYTIDGGTTLTQIGSNISPATSAANATFTPGSTLTFAPGTTVQFRLYGWNASGAGGTLRITDGTPGVDADTTAIAVIPTPGSAALLGLGMVAAGRRRRA